MYKIFRIDSEGRTHHLANVASKEEAVETQDFFIEETNNPSIGWKEVVEPVVETFAQVKERFAEELSTQRRIISLRDNLEQIKKELKTLKERRKHTNPCIKDLLKV